MSLSKWEPERWRTGGVTETDLQTGEQKTTLEQVRQGWGAWLGLRQARQWCSTRSLLSGFSRATVGSPTATTTPGGITLDRGSVED